MQRRQFLHSAGLVLGSTSLAGARELAPRSRLREDEFRPDDWSSVREQFPLTRDYIHLATPRTGFPMRGSPPAC